MVSKKSRVTTYEEQDDSLDTEPESDSGLSQDCMVKVKSTSRERESSKAGGNHSGGKGEEKAMGGHSRKKKSEMKADRSCTCNHHRYYTQTCL